MQPIFKYALSGKVKKLEDIIKEGVNINEQHPVFRTTALHMAVDERHYEAVKLLLDSKANIYLQDVDGQTALHKAVLSLKRASNNTEIVDSLNIIKALFLKEEELYAQKSIDKLELRDIKSKLGNRAENYIKSNSSLYQKYLETLPNTKGYSLQELISNKEKSANIITLDSTTVDINNNSVDVSGFGLRKRLTESSSQEKAYKSPVATQSSDWGFVKNGSKMPQSYNSDNELGYISRLNFLKPFFGTSSLEEEKQRLLANKENMSNSKQL